MERDIDVAGYGHPVRVSRDRWPLVDLELHTGSEAHAAHVTMTTGETKELIVALEEAVFATVLANNPVVEQAEKIADEKLGEGT
jgi:hypothetical protein